MAIQFTLRRGNSLENQTFIGANSELVFDTENIDLHIHDGQELGGYCIPSLILYQKASNDNGKVWIKKHSNGLLEMGGIIEYGSPEKSVVNFPIPFINMFYTVSLTPLWDNPNLNAVLDFKKSTENYITVFKHGNPMGVQWIAIGAWK